MGAWRFVDVDITIEVCGAAPVNILVKGHTFSHQFAEGSLGMNFLKKNECISDIYGGRLTMKDLWRSGYYHTP